MDRIIRGRNIFLVGCVLIGWAAIQAFTQPKVVKSTTLGKYQVWYSEKGICSEHIYGEEIPKCLVSIR